MFLDVRVPSREGPTAHEKGFGGAVKLKSGVAIIDLRQAIDFEKFSLPDSINLPFADQSRPSPFFDPSVLESLWRKLDNHFTTPRDELLPLVQRKQILLLCYDGDSSRVATSVLRAKGYEAVSIRGGFRALGELDAGVANGEFVTDSNKAGMAVMREVELTTPS